MKDLLPINQNVILDITENEKESKTASGIIIPDSAKEKPKFAKLIALSNIENPEIVVGDIVYYKEFSGTETKFEGKDYLVIPYEDIMAKVVETEAI